MNNNMDIYNLIIKKVKEEKISPKSIDVIPTDNTGKTPEDYLNAGQSSFEENIFLKVLNNTLSGGDIKRLSPESLNKIINIKDQNGRNVLHHAVINNNMEVFAQFLEAMKRFPSGTLTADETGKTPFQYAEERWPKQAEKYTPIGFPSEYIKKTS